MGLNLHDRRVQVICLCIVIVLGVLSYYVLDPLLHAEEPEPLEISAEDIKGSRKILVYVVGAVKHPGVYEIPEGSHVYDAIKAAGDVLPYAAMNEINMAEPVKEAMKIYVPLDPYQSDPAGQGLVNINTAGEKELETLPGVGKTTAEKIITYREEHGRFESIEDIMKVPSIGESKFKKMADKITL